ncbi:MAG: NAD-binding protein [Firmicutes bacterium]|nr:NAD-binding protein [Bacillota bacterium]
MNRKKKKIRCFWKKCISFLKLIHLPTILAIVIFYLLLCLICYFITVQSGEESSFIDVLLLNMLATLGNDYAYTENRWLKLLGIVFLAFGMLAVSVVTGYISSAFVGQRLDNRRDRKRMENLKNHIIICGYKSDIKNLILDILRKNKKLKPSDIVLVNNVEDVKIQNLKEAEEMKGLHFLRGDFTEEQTLLRSKVQYASKVLILGENEEGMEDELTDSRAFVATLMVRNLNAKCHICTEVRTERYKNYLEAQNCAEIIYTDAYTRYILSTATNYSGMSKVMASFLDNGDGISVQVRPISEEWFGKSFAELSNYYKKEKNIIVLGILENMGVEKELKHQILSEAQKSTNYGEIVQKLKNVRKLETNLPRLNPFDDYMLGRNMGAIILGEEI